MLRLLRDSTEPLTAAEIRAAITDPVPAHTTVLTVLDRLVRKGEVERGDDRARGVGFRAVHTEDEHATTSMLDVLAEARDRDAVLMAFAGQLDESDLDVLRRALGR